MMKTIKNHGNHDTLDIVDGRDATHGPGMEPPTTPGIIRGRAVDVAGLQGRSRCPTTALIGLEAPLNILCKIFFRSEIMISVIFSQKLNIYALKGNTLLIFRKARISTLKPSIP